MVRFYLVLILFLISLLALFRAPEYHLWMLAVCVTEFPLIFFCITLLLTLTGFWAQKLQLPGTILGVICMLIFLSPVIRAALVARHLKRDMARSFTGLPSADSKVIFPTDKAPFSFWNLFKRPVYIPYVTIQYVHYADTAMTMDFYPSKAKGDRPCVIIVHGGSWASGDSQQLPELNSFLANRGYHVASINYRMAPRWKNPAPAEDVQAAITYMKQHAAAMHVDTSKFVLLGRSAGAQIALLAGYTLHDPDIAGIIDFYGPADMVWGYSIPSSPLIMNSRKVMSDYLGGTYSQMPQKYFDSSPVEFVNRNSPPTLMIQGMNDALVSPLHCSRLIKKLKPAGVKYYWLKLPWATHGFDYNLYGPGGQLSTYAVETFLNTITR